MVSEIDVARAEDKGTNMESNIYYILMNCFPSGDASTTHFITE
jgi:hypothetical protein